VAQLFSLGIIAHENTRYIAFFGFDSGMALFADFRLVKMAWHLAHYFLCSITFRAWRLPLLFGRQE
jgi:hypothetical protein